MKKQLRLTFGSIVLLIILLGCYYWHFKTYEEPLGADSQDYSEYPYYLDMMDDLSCNVYDVIAAGEIYFKDRDRGKGSGYKQFRRWVMLNEDQFYPSGDRMAYNPLLPYEVRGQYELGNVTPGDRPSFEGATNATMFLNTWEEVGPAVELITIYDNRRNGNGRVESVWVNPSDANHIYVGCRGGGFWKTTDGGANWSPKTDQLGITGVKSIAVNPANVNEVYIATSAGGSNNYSIGVFKSTNGGDTWSPTGYALDMATDLTKINKIIINPSNTSILFAATNKGLIRTTDGFQTYANVLSGDIVDIEFKPGDANTVYAASNTNDTLYKSTNGGASFTSTGLITTNKMQIAVTPAAPNNVYVSDKNYFAKSIDSGASFTLGGSPDGGTGQYGGFGVSDIDPNLIINGSLDTYRSTNGGSTFSKVTDWIYANSTGVGGNFVHGDNRDIVIVNGVIYMGTDGWLVKSTDGGLNYDVLTFNMGNHEIYEHGMGVSQADDNTLVVGTQDNGTSILYDGVWRHWKGGDGGTSMADHSNKNILYGSLYNGDFKRTDDAGASGNGTDLGDTKPGTLPPMVQHPTNASTIFLGEGNGEVWKSTDKGTTWTTIASLGVTDVVDELAIAPSNAQVLYTSVKNRIWKTTNGGANWNEVTGALPNLVIKGIAIDYDDPNHVVICYTGYSSSNKVFETNDGGSSWTNISTGLPNLTTHDVVFQNNTDDGIYLATDVGVYYRDNVSSNWSLYGSGLPNCVVNDMEIQHSTGYLYVATWGRGVWKVLLNNFVPQAPVANFLADFTSVEEGNTVNFSDTSANVPTSWSWSFPGGTPSISTAQHPTIVYNTSGTYDVTLTVTNAQGSDVETKVGYITVIVPNDLKAHYKFDGDLTDTSVYGLDLTDSGAVSYPGTYESDHSGNANKTVTTGGASSYLSNAQVFPISGNMDRTVTAWIKTSTMAYQGIVCLGNTSPNFHKFSVIVNASGQFRTEVSGTGIDGTSTVADGTWHHVATTYSYDSGSGNGTIKLYVDGVEENTVTSATWGSLLTDGASLVVGNEKFDLTSRGFVGALDDVRIYSKALTAQEINDIKNEVAPTADFLADSTSVQEGGTVNFTDASTGSPTSWSWSFPGGTPSTSAVQNPSVVYDTAGVYDVSLTATNALGNDVVTKMGYVTVTALASTLQVQYVFDGNIVDGSTYGRNGTNSGVVFVADGEKGNVADFDGTDNVTVTGYSGVLASGARTVVGWVKTNTPNKTIVNWGAATASSKFTLLNDASGFLRLEIGGGYLVGSTNIANGQWHHIACVFEDDGTPNVTDAVLFVDGQQETISSSQGVTLNTVESGDVIIGNDTFSRGFNGKMSDFRVYSEALSILQINDILNESPTYPVAEFNSDVASIIEGSSVSFTDLSTGSPTSWSWSFPGGTPSSSTVQNPSVVYNTSGTYNVTLVVTNNDGQGTITKTGYITVTQPVGCTTILSDDFENGFGNWNDGGSDASTSSSGGNGNSASIKLRDGNGANSSIYTNALDLSALTEVTFNFSYYPVSMESNEDFFLEVSTNGGTTFATVQSWSSGTDFSNGVHYDESVVVSGPFATNTVFRMRCDASGKNDMVYIDDVTIQDCPTISSKTVGAKKDSVISINTELEANEVMPLIKLYPNPVSNTMVVKLKGENSLSGSVSVSIYTLSGKQIRTDDMFRLNDRIEINMSGLSQGVYMVAINASGKINYFKIVKN